MDSIKRNLVPLSLALQKSFRIFFVEFVSREDEHIRNWTIPSDYTMDNFIKAMGRRGFLLDSRQPVIPSRDLLAFKRTTHQQTG